MKPRTLFNAVFPLVLFMGFSEAEVQAQVDQDTLLLMEVEIIENKIVLPALKMEVDQNMATDVVRDVGTALRTEPNVSGIRKGGIAIDPVVRGFKYDQVDVLLNGGVKIEGGCPNRMDPVTSHVEMENIRQVTIIKGPYVLKYGPVMGALINLHINEPQPLEKPGLHGQVLYGFESNWNGQREQVELFGGNEKVYYQVSGGYKDYGNYTGGNDVSYKTSFTKANATAGIGLRLADQHRLVVNYAYNMGRDVLFPTLPMDEQSDDSHVLFANYNSGKLGEKLENIASQAHYSQVRHVMDNYDRPSAKNMAAVTEVDALNTGGKAEAVLRLGKTQWLTGLDYEYVYKDGTKKMTMVMTMDSLTTTSTKYSNIWLKAHSDNLGWYNELQGEWRDATYILAFRVDYNQADSRDTFSLVKDDIAYYQDLASHFVNLSFGAGVKVPVTQNFAVNILVGSGTRSPSLLERYIKLLPVQFDSYDYLGNPQLKPETNNQADLILEYDLRKWGQISTAGFFSYITNYILGEVLPPSVIKPSSQGALGVKQFNNIDHVYLTGFEFSYYSPAEKKWNLRLNVAATYGTNPEAVRYIVSEGEVTGEETLRNDPLPEIPPLEGSVFFSWKFFRSKLKPQVMVRLVSAQNRVSEAFTEEATPGFYTIGASVNYYPCKYFSLLAGVDNIMDQAYYEHLNRRIFGSTDNFYEPGRVFYFSAIVKF